VNLPSYAELAVRLANTAVLAPGEPDPLGSAEDCARALSDCLTGPVTGRDLDVLKYLRDEFTAIFTAAARGDEKGSMDRMNALLVQFPIHPEMTNHSDQRWHVHLAQQGSVADQFAAGAVIAVALTVSQFGVNRLGVCAIAACPRVFLDASPNKSRRYCAEHAAAKGNVSTLRRPSAGRPRSHATSAGSAHESEQQSVPAVS
jgi:predicted RNA-binding Zn ribbon-like protein